MYAKLYPNNSSIVLKYEHQGRMRFATKIKISADKTKNGKFKDWDYKNGCIRNIVENYDSSNSILFKLRDKANDIISEYLNNDIRITAKELEEKLRSTRQVKQEKHNALFSEHYNDFYEIKKKLLVDNPRRSDESFKSYESFRSTIKDYEFDLQKPIKVTDILSYEWCIDFTNWMQKTRPKSEPKNEVAYKYKSKGDSSMNTLHKRYQALKSFCVHLKEKKIIQDFDIVLKYCHEQIWKVSAVKTTLDINELGKLAEFKLDERLGRVRDLFLLACYLGLRWGDLEKFNKIFIVTIKGKKVYKTIAHKTENSSGVEVKIPLAKITLRLLEKYDYKLNFISDQKANEYLKEALEKTGMFDEHTLKKDKTGRQLRRWEIISFHKGRDTFITNLCNTVPLKELMSYSGHKQLGTLQKYVDKTREINPEYINIFDSN